MYTRHQFSGTQTNLCHSSCIEYVHVFQSMILEVIGGPNIRPSIRVVVTEVSSTAKLSGQVVRPSRLTTRRLAVPAYLLPFFLSLIWVNPSVLTEQLFNSSEKRLARTLLLLARYGKEDQPHGVLPKMSQETLADMIGTTRSRVNFFMNKFRKLGFIKYNGGLQINTSLLSVVLHE